MSNDDRLEHFKRFAASAKDPNLFDPQVFDACYELIASRDAKVVGVTSSEVHADLEDVLDVLRYRCVLRHRYPKAKDDPKLQTFARLPDHWDPHCRLALSMLTDVVYPKAARLLEEHVLKPILPHDVLYRVKRRNLDDSFTGELPDDLFSDADVRAWDSTESKNIMPYLHALRHNIARSMSRSLPAAQEPQNVSRHHGLEVDAVFRVARAKGLGFALSYLSDLWADGWIQNVDAYRYTMIPLRYAALHHAEHAIDDWNAYCRATRLPAERNDLLAFAHQLYALFRERLETIRRETQAFSEWCRALFGLWPDSVALYELLYVLKEQTRGSDRDNLSKKWRYVEEVRADIVGCLQSPLYVVPGLLASAFANARSVAAARNAVYFYCHGRVTIPHSLETAVVACIPEELELRQDDDLCFRVMYALMRDNCSDGQRAAFELLNGSESPDTWLKDVPWKRIKDDTRYAALDEIGNRLVSSSVQMQALCKLTSDSGEAQNLDGMVGTDERVLLEMTNGTATGVVIANAYHETEFSLISARMAQLDSAPDDALSQVVVNHLSEACNSAASQTISVLDALVLLNDYGVSVDSISKVAVCMSSVPVVIEMGLDDLKIVRITPYCRIPIPHLSSDYVAAMVALRQTPQLLLVLLANEAARLIDLERIQITVPGQNVEPGRSK